MAKPIFKARESDLATHPGELLAEELEVRGMTQKALAVAMQRPAQAVNEIVRGKKAITADTAVELEEVLGVSAQFWLGLQTRYDLVLARRAHLDRRAAATRARVRRSAVGIAETGSEYTAAKPRPGAAPKAAARSRAQK